MGIYLLFNTTLASKFELMILEIIKIKMKHYGQLKYKHYNVLLLVFKCVKQ